VSYPVASLIFCLLSFSIRVSHQNIPELFVFVFLAHHSEACILLQRLIIFVFHVANYLILPTLTQVFTVADRTTRHGSSRSPCCAQLSTVCVINWWLTTVTIFSRWPSTHVDSTWDYRSAVE